MLRATSFVNSQVRNSIAAEKAFVMIAAYAS